MEFEKTTVPLVAVCVPAAAARLFADAVMVEAFRPNDTLFEFENVKAEASFEVVPAEMLMLAALTLIDAVRTDPFSPKLTLLELENVMAERFCDVVPADTLMFVRLVATEAVSVEPFRPKLTLLPFENVIAERLLDVVPADTLMFVSDVATDAVIVEAFRPNEIPFEFENVNAEARFEVVPALRLMLACVDATVTEAVTTEEFAIPNVTLFEFEKTTVPLVAVCVPAPTARLFADAVMVDAFRPNEIPFEFENVNAEARFEVVPALRLMLACVDATVTEAVTTEEFAIPNVTLFEFEKTTVPLVAVWVPAPTARLFADAVMVDAFRPNEMPFEFENVNAEARFEVVPALRLMLAWVEATVTDAVTTELFDIPKVTLLEFEKTTVPLVAVCVPAAAARLFADAVIVEAFRPKEMLLLFENVNAEASFDVVPAEMLMLAALTLIEAVRTDPFSPKLTLLELENVMAERFCDVVPADTLMFVRLVATEAVSVEPFRPKLTLLPFENVIAERLLDVVPADTLMFVSDVATDAVIVEAFRPNEIPFEFENVNAEARFEVVPADRLMLACVDATVTEAVTTEEFAIPNVTLFEFEKTTVPLVAVWVPAPTARLFADAVMVEAFRPKEMLLLFENVNAEASFDVVPAEMLMLAALTLIEAVRTDATGSSPNETLLAFENVIAERFCEVVPAETLISAEAVIVEAFRPNETLFESEKVTAVRVFEVVPAEMLMAAMALIDAVTTEEFDIPNVTPFEFEKTTVPLVAVCVPAASAMPLLPPEIVALATTTSAP